MIGRHLVERLRERGDEVVTLPGAEAVAGGNSVAAALAGADAVVHLAGEPVAQRWSDDVKRRIRDSRVEGARKLVEAMRGSGERPAVFVSASAVGYYGPRGDEEVDETELPGTDFLAQVCVDWEAAADGAGELGVRVVKLRNGVVLDRRGGALKQMLTPFRLGLGGPVAGGRQWMPWIHMDDAVGMALSAIDDAASGGPVNITAPAPVRNREFSKALGRALHRPAIAPVPKLALKVMFGEMGEVVATGQRVVPRRAQQLGYQFQHPEIDEALRAAIS